MATITKEKILKNQAMAPEGWTYDWRHYAAWGEHQIFRNLEQPDGSIIRGTVSWWETYETRTNEFGCSWNVRTGKYVPELHVNRWVKSWGDSWSSQGLGKRTRLSDVEHDKRVYKELCKLTVTDQMIMDTWNGAKKLQLTL